MPAFTRLELIVALVALIVVGGLLMPAINNGRTTTRTLCASRISEVTKSIQHFESIYHRYPGYVDAFGRDATGVVKIGTWVVPLLPYLEREETYNLWQDAQTTESWTRCGGGNSKLNQIYYPRVVVFTCPRDQNNDETAGPLSFAANSGYWPEPLPASFASLDAHETVLRATQPHHGVFSNQLPPEIICLQTQNAEGKILGSAMHRPTISKNMVDGLSNTICLAENLTTDRWSYVGRPKGWAKTEINGQAYFGDELSASRSIRTHVGLVWQLQTPPETKLPEFARPSSGHGEVVNAAFLDGHVQAMDSDIDYRVYQQLMTPDDKAAFAEVGR